MLKLTIPDVPDFYSGADQAQKRGEGRRAVRRLHQGGRLQAPRLEPRHDRQARGPCAEDLKHSMTDAEFNAALAKSIDEIYQALDFSVKV